MAYCLYVESNCTTENIDNAGHVLIIPLDGDRPVHFLVPEAEPGHVHAIASCGQDYTIYNILEVVISPG